jgi:hypothetical protein
MRKNQNFSVSCSALSNFSIHRSMNSVNKFIGLLQQTFKVLINDFRQFLVSESIQIVRTLINNNTKLLKGNYVLYCFKDVAIV